MLRSAYPLGVVPHAVRNGEGVGTEPVVPHAVRNVEGVFSGPVAVAESLASFAT